MRYAIDLIDAIALADGTRTLRDVLMNSRVPEDTFMVTETQLREVLSEYLVLEDIVTVIETVKTTVKVERDMTDE